MVFGILHLGTLILNFIDFNSNNGITINQNMVERAFGNYWFGLWIYPLTYFGLTELFWIDKVRTSKVARIIIALVIFGVMHLEKYVILVTTIYRDYAIDRTEGFPVTIFGQIGLGWMLNLVIFGFIVFIGLKMKTLYNKLYE